MMKVAKEFHWEMGHRLTFHKGLCKNLHGHSYKMIIEFSGNTDKNGILIDFYDINSFIKPILDELDHSIMVNESDKELIEALKKIGSRFVIINSETTAENICIYLLELIKKTNLPKKISKLRIQVFETDTTYAE